MEIRNHHSYLLNGGISLGLESVIDVVRLIVKFVVKEVVLAAKLCSAACLCSARKRKRND